MREGSMTSGVAPQAADRPTARGRLLGVARELAEKYSLSTDAALEITAETLSAALSSRAGCQVIVKPSGDEVRALFLGDGPFPEAKEKGLGGMFGNDLKHLRNDLERAFARRAARDALTMFRPLVGRAVLGEVVKLLDDGGLLAEVENGGYDGGKVTAICEKREVMVKERGSGRMNERLWFYVKSAKNADHQGLPRLDVRLSRNSMRLPELLLVKELLGRGKCVAAPRVRCVRRIAGVRSEITSSTPMDKEILRTVGILLGGEIIHVVA